MFDIKIWNIKKSFSSSMYSWLLVDRISGNVVRSSLENTEHFQLEASGA